MPKELLLLHFQAASPPSDSVPHRRQTRSQISPRVLQLEGAELLRPSTEIVDAHAALSVSGSLVRSVHMSRLESLAARLQFSECSKGNIDVERQAGSKPIGT